MKNKIIKEDYSGLPFPQTAKLLGGILVLKGNDISLKDIEKFRKAFYESIKESNFKKPKFIKGE
jgi:hypothetical protein